MKPMKRALLSTSIHLTSVIACIAIMLGSTYAHAEEENECGARARQIVEHAYPTAQSADENTLLFIGDSISLPNSKYLYEPHVMVCKQWPADSTKLLVAVPLMRDSEPGGYDNTGDLDILVLENDTLRVLQRYRAKGLMSDDAIGITDIRFDTARYHLAPGKTAFGVRIHYRGASRVNPYYASTLRLYLLEKDQLKPVLDNIVVDQGGGEWDGRCAGEFHSTKRILSIAPDMHHGLALITVKETSESSVSKAMPDDKCLESELHTNTRKTTLTYDGNVYRVPKRMKWFED